MRKQARAERRGIGDNPFETRKNKTRFAVMGRKVKGTVVRTGFANQEGHKRREQTIGPEYEMRGKTSKFVDKRFGERDAEMSEAEKMGVRFQQERLRQTRNEFSLTGAEDLTHLGMSLGAAGSGKGGPNTLEDDLFFRVDDEDDAFGGNRGLLDEETVKNLHFGGGGADEERAKKDDAAAPADRKRTKREVMDEIVAKSKQHRAQRKQENQEQFELVQQLDEQLKDITPFLTMAPRISGKRRKKGEDAEEKSGARPRAAEAVLEGGEEVAAAPVEREHEADYVPDEYDMLVKELRVQSREAHAGDRLRSRTEEAQARMARLRALELMRERRMGRSDGKLGWDNDEELGDAKKPEVTLASVIAAAGGQGEGGDDADSDGGDDDEDGEGGGEAGAGAKRERRRRPRRSGKNAEAVAPRGEWVLERRWARDMIDEEGALRDADMGAAVVDARTGDELPFVLPVPGTAAELWDLLDGNTPAVGRVALQRMLGNTDPALDPANAARLVQLQMWLLGAALRGSGSVAHSDMLFDAVRRLLLMLPNADAHPIHSEQSPYFAYRVLLNAAVHVEPAIPSGVTPSADLELLLPVKASGRRGKKHTGNRVAYHDEHAYPQMGLVTTLLQTLRIFSSSDRFHPVCSPALTLLLDVLATHAHVTAVHFASSLLIADSVLGAMHAAQRFVPEPVVFCTALLRMVASKAAPASRPQWTFPDALAHNTVAHCAATMLAYARSWSELGLASAARPLLLDALAALELHSAESGAALRTVLDTLEPLVHLRLRTVPVVPIVDLKPLLFLTDSGGFSVSRDHDPDAERRQQRALRKQLKSERRGAMKELKRDRAYVNAIKATELDEETAERKTSLKKIMHFLQDQAAEGNLEAKLKKNSMKM